jgi:c-di-GMP phosphodiesterase
VEEIQDFEDCVRIGFDLFQGYFFAKPEVLSRIARPVNSSAALALLVEMQRPLIDITKMESLVTGDPTLAFRLLALVNSSLAGLTTRVSSVHHAIVLLGIEQVRQLATLLTMASSAHTNQEIVVLAATRAKMARLLAPAELSGSAFTVGLLSVIDSIFRTPMADLIRELPLSPDVADALLGKGGALGLLLETIRAYEVADVERLEELWPDRFEELRLAFGEATTWADDFRRQIVAA